MIYFFGNSDRTLYAIHTSKTLDTYSQEKLVWLFGNQPLINKKKIEGNFVGPRATMITPWSTNAVEIAQNMGITKIVRIEEYLSKDVVGSIDPMLVVKFTSIDQSIFNVDISPEKVLPIEDIATYNKQEGLALNHEEIDYLKFK